MTILEAKHICRPEYLASFLSSLRQAYDDMRSSLGDEQAKRGCRGCVDRLINDYIEAKIDNFISRDEFLGLMERLSQWERDNETLQLSTGGKLTQQPICTEDVLLNNHTKRDYEHDYLLGCVLTPISFSELPLLSANSCFISPQTVDVRDYCITPSDQGKLPWCAAYAATGFASNILWRKEDVPMVFDPEPIYRYAKKVDGYPNIEGTTLVAALQGLLECNIFSSKQCEVRVLRTVEQVKYAIHKFGCCIVGVNISREWYGCNKKNDTINGGVNPKLLGGHAVLACGYLREGIIIQNSWGVDWGAYGFALITWKEFERIFQYGAVLNNCLYDTRVH